MSTVKLETSKGDILIELNADKAPATVENFLNYVRDGFYDGTIFHRVIENFMIQGGGFNDQMIQKPTRDPINHKDNAFLNYTAPSAQGWGYCVFGQVTDGMDVVDEIARVKTTNRDGHSDVPEEAIVITSAKEI